MTATTAILALLALGAQDERDEPKDRIGKDRAPVVVTKVLAEVRKRNSAAIAEKVHVGEELREVGTFEGILKRDFAAVKGPAEVYAKGAAYLVNLGGRYDPPDKLEGQEALTASSFRNPALFLAEIGRVAAGAQFGPEEEVDGRPCVALDMLADPTLIKQYCREIAERVDRGMRGGRGGGLVGGRGAIFNVANAIDEKATTATFKLLVSREDLSIRRLDFTIRPKLKPNAIPNDFRLGRLPLDNKTEILFSKWDEEVAFDVPLLIRTKWGVK